MDCGTPIGWRDNIPLLSWVLLRGRCRHCGVRISPLYPAVELATALLVAACVLDFRRCGRVVPSRQWVLGAVGASAFLFLAVVAYPAGMGMGDVKLALAMGAALGKTV